MFAQLSWKRVAGDVEDDCFILICVQEAPAATYEFSTDDQAQRAEICRRTKDGVSCIKLQGNSKKMFETMQVRLILLSPTSLSLARYDEDNSNCMEQGLGFFCALPADPEKTHMECKPLMPPK
jgi:hypothetical protein